MEPVMAPVGVRDAKNRFSELTLAVNETGKPLIVLKNNKPWVTIQPADSALARRRERLERFRELTRQIESETVEEPVWDKSVSDRELLNEERVRRFG